MSSFAVGNRCQGFSRAKSTMTVLAIAVLLGGVGSAAAWGAEDFRLKPDEVAFGPVSIGSTESKTVRIQNRTGASLDDLIFNRCLGTSEEFSWEPADLFSVDARKNERVKIFYSPSDEGVDEGCLELKSGDGSGTPVELPVSGEGFEGPAGESDYDIKKLRVTKQVELGSGEEVRVRLQVRNGGSANEPREATVVGIQNGVTVYEETLEVSRRAGNRGVSQFVFPSFLPTDPGDILWMATIDDDNEDTDEAVAATRVIDSDAGPSEGADLDILKFKAKKTVSLTGRSRVWLKLKVENNGTLDEARTATLVGEQGGVEVYLETLDISDDPGDDDPSKFRFPSYEAEAAGEIVWTLSFDDDNSDLDMALAITRVLP